MSKRTKILSFWGKGGVGKTTCAASVAVFLASRGFRTFLITSDPTPSLSDILGVKVGANITRIEPFNLEAIELDEDTVVKMWKEKFGDEVYRVVSSFLPIDRSIIDYVAGAPGIGDEFMLAYIFDLYKSGKYDFIIWDTAPAGGTLRLLRLEEQLYKHLGDAAKLYLSLKSFFDRIRRGGRDVLEIINDWRRLAEDVLEMMSSKDFVAHIIAIPEWLSFSQTGRILKELNEFKVTVGKLIINQIIQVKSPHDSLLADRARIHEKYVKMFRETYGRFLDIMLIPVQPYEIKGVDALIRFSINLKEILNHKLTQQRS
ncbi:hypothetical protein DRN86_00330 [Candidatus Geothermarchaeota archaeon]|nr:MAG: hypothetical protein DRN86_00330 [Candidatus Geothermarchaeota archaeon]